MADICSRMQNALPQTCLHSVLSLPLPIPASSLPSPFTPWNRPLLRSYWTDAGEKGFLWVRMTSPGKEEKVPPSPLCLLTCCLPSPSHPLYLHPQPLSPLSLHDLPFSRLRTQDNSGIIIVQLQSSGLHRLLLLVVVLGERINTKLPFVRCLHREYTLHYKQPTHYIKNSTQSEVGDSLQCYVYFGSLSSVVKKSRYSSSILMYQTVICFAKSY